MYVLLNEYCFDIIFCQQKDIVCKTFRIKFSDYFLCMYIARMAYLKNKPF